MAAAAAWPDTPAAAFVQTVLPLPHTTQRLTAGATTEPLLRRPCGGHEKFVATGPFAGPAGKIWRLGRWALALARRLGRSCFQLTLAYSLAVALALLAAAFLTLRAAAVVLGRTPAPPVLSFLPAVRAAIAGLGTPGPEPAFTAL